MANAELLWTGFQGTKQCRRNSQYDEHQWSNTMQMRMISLGCKDTRMARRLLRARHDSVAPGSRWHAPKRRG